MTPLLNAKWQQPELPEMCWLVPTGYVVWAESQPGFADWLITRGGTPPMQPILRHDTRDQDLAAFTMRDEVRDAQQATRGVTRVRRRCQQGGSKP